MFGQRRVAEDIPRCSMGIGNRRRIRFLRSRSQTFAVNAGSHTTQRLKDEAGINIVSFRYACVARRLGCELGQIGSLSHVFCKQGIHIIADPVTEVVADSADFIETGD